MNFKKAKPDKEIKIGGNDKNKMDTDWTKQDRKNAGGKLTIED